MADSLGFAKASINYVLKPAALTSKIEKNVDKRDRHIKRKYVNFLRNFTGNSKNPEAETSDWTTHLEVLALMSLGLETIDSSSSESDNAATASRFLDLLLSSTRRRLVSEKFRPGIDGSDFRLPRKSWRGADMPSG